MQRGSTQRQRMVLSGYFCPPPRTATPCMAVFTSLFTILRISVLMIESKVVGLLSFSSNPVQIVCEGTLPLKDIGAQMFMCVILGQNQASTAISIIIPSEITCLLSFQITADVYVLLSRDEPKQSDQMKDRVPEDYLIG